MNVRSASGSFPEIAKTWSILQGQVFLKPIRSEGDYEKMLALANELVDRLEQDDGPLNELFDLVTDLIALWAHSVPVPTAEPREVLRYLLDAHGLKQKDLADVASPSVISDVLAGRRAVSKKVAKALAKRFGVDASVFL